VKFVDSCKVKVIAGRGGNGAVAFRREKFVPFGGPSGGDGGRGGDVVFETDEGMSTLIDFSHAHTLRAKDGEPGQGSDCYGRRGEDLLRRVPVGTQVYDAASGELLFDLDRPETKVVVAQGGRGGRGNIHFATPQDRAPRRSEPGGLGEERDLRLELKVLADVGLLGFPNVGKSTFIRAVSRARPKVADYPFTTLTPHLGVVALDEETSFVLADIPGLIPGAADGAGLGIRFLKHVERTRALLHLVTLDHAEGRDPMSDYLALTAELAKFDPELARRPTVVAMSKADLPEVREAWERLRPAFAKRKVKLHLVSAATGEGVRELLFELLAVVEGRLALEAPEPLAPAAPRASRPSKEKATKAAPAVEEPAKAKPAAKKAKPAAKKAEPAAKKAKPAGTKAKGKAKTKPTATKAKGKAKKTKPTATKARGKAKKTKPSPKRPKPSPKKTKGKAKKASRARRAR